MNEFFENLNDLIAIVQLNWEKMIITLLALNAFLKAFRDATDLTPSTDDNKIERILTIITKSLNYLLLGKRPK